MACRPRFDYDEGNIHQTYRSGRALTAAQLELWSALLRAAVEPARPRLILDLGCGVGRFSVTLRDLFAAWVIGIDRSARMLAAARTDPALSGIGWVRGSVEALPIRDGTADLAWLFLVYHHLADRPAALRECCRVLGGAAPLLIVNSTLESLDSYLWLPFFPSARDIDRARLPNRSGLVEDARGAGLRLRWHRPVANPVASSLRMYADRIASRTISTLQLVPDHEFERGIVEFRRFCEREDRGQPVLDEIDAFLFARAE
jgi:SAM-dependent methyltransferase